MNDAATGRARPCIALLGNPSDLFGGTVLAATIDTFETVVDIIPTTFYAPPAFLSDAAELQRLVFERVAAGRAGCAMTLRTDVPSQAGLGGSSAILIATVRAIDSYYGLGLAPLDIAAVAWAVERDDLGIVAGPHDRVIQALGGLQLMDFSGPDRIGRHRCVDATLLPPLLIAWPNEPDQASDDGHRLVWERIQAGDTMLGRQLLEFASIAEHGTAALEGGDHATFADAVDTNFDLRCSLFDVDADDRRLVDVARAAGGAAKLSGSGGSIVAVPRPGGRLEEISEALVAAGASVSRSVRIALAP